MRSDQWHISTSLGVKIRTHIPSGKLALADHKAVILADVGYDHQCPPPVVSGDTTATQKRLLTINGDPDEHPHFLDGLARLLAKITGGYSAHNIAPREFQGQRWNTAPESENTPYPEAVHRGASFGF